MAGSSGAVPIPFFDVAIMITLIVTEIIKIASFYGYAWQKISKNDITAILNGEKYIERDENNDEYTNTNEATESVIPNQVALFDIIKSLFLGSFLTAAVLVIGDGFKFIPVIGTILGCIVGSIVDFSMVILYGKRANDYFRAKCQADDGTLFFCIRCHEYEIIFKKMKEFREDYIIYP